MDVNRDVAMNECPVCGAAKSRMERHLVDVHGFSQDRIAEFKAQKKSRKIIASGKPIHVTEKVDDVTVEHCFNHLGHEARRSQLRLEKSAEQYIVSLLRDGLTVRQVYKKVRMEVRGGPRTRLYFVTTRDIRCELMPARNLMASSFTVQHETPAEMDSCWSSLIERKGSGYGSTDRGRYEWTIRST
ncbi:hypothetical protein RB195_005877 [Necator americanus]|uniref:Uncharacterized protein n=1 Tax=Necator americanus TaxID=51031 RepID=A0ABR1BT43_NECAM